MRGKKKAGLKYISGYRYISTRLEISFLLASQSTLLTPRPRTNVGEKSTIKGSHLISTLSAPSGVTIVAAAKAYAAKLAASPPPTEQIATRGKKKRKKNR